MSKNRAIYPKDAESYYQDWGFSPGYFANGMLFVSGYTGTHSDGTVPITLEEQTHLAFKRIGKTLTAAGMDFSNIVEMTTYHVGIGDSLEKFIHVKSEYLTEPNPAWTAIGVSELASKGAIIEIRVTACLPEN